MSGKEMANDINKAIASGGYVIVPEKAVDGAGRNAIYVYMTYNGKDGYQSWKISGGLNGGLLLGLVSGLVIGFFLLAVLAVASYLAMFVFFLFAVISVIITLLKYHQIMNHPEMGEDIADYGTPHCQDQI